MVFQAESECSLVRLDQDLRDENFVLTFQCHPEHTMRVFAAQSQQAMVDQMVNL